MKTTQHTLFKCWLWPNHVIGKSYSGLLREEHNALVNAHNELLELVERLANNKSNEIIVYNNIRSSACRVLAAIQSTQAKE